MPILNLLPTLNLLLLHKFNKISHNNLKFNQFIFRNKYNSSNNNNKTNNKNPKLFSNNSHNLFNNNSRN